MSDNVNSNPGSGSPIATDDIGGVQYQRVKLIHGADGTNDGDIASTNPLPVQQEKIATPTHTAVTVTSTSGVALASNSSRIYALFMNNSNSDIYLKLGATAVASEGILITGNGGSFAMSRAFGNLYTGAVNAIHANTGNKTLLVTEGI